MRERSAGVQALLLAMIVYAVYLATGVPTSGDSRWVVPAALSLIERGDADLDEYTELLEASGYYAIETVEGRHYSIFPVAVPVLSTPLVALADLGAQAAYRAVPPFREAVDARADGAEGQPPVPHVRGSDVAAALSAGDERQSPLLHVYWRVEQAIASFYVACAAALVFVIARRQLTAAYALALALVFAFGTSAWSVASTALWQHGPSMLFLLLGTFGVLKAKDHIAWLALAGLSLALAYTLRPTNSIPLVLYTVYVLVVYRWRVWPWFAGAALVAIPFIVYNLTVYDALLPAYFRGTRIDLHPAFIEALVGNLVSPGRGLFVYSPVLLFAAVGARMALRQPALRGLASIWIAIIAAHWVAVSLFPHWWGGVSYGPRLFTDVVPFLILLLVPVLKWIAESRGPLRHVAAAAIAVTAGASAFMHYTGAAHQTAWHWNLTPTHIDIAPGRVWDWRETPFTRPY